MILGELHIYNTNFGPKKYIYIYDSLQKFEAKYGSSIYWTLQIKQGFCKSHTLWENERRTQHPFPRCNKANPTHFYIGRNFRQRNSYPLN